MLTWHGPPHTPDLQPAKAGSLLYAKGGEGLLRLAFKFEHKVERVAFACAAFSPGAHPEWRRLCAVGLGLSSGGITTRAAWLTCRETGVEWMRALLLIAGVD